jgi:hypothetical protein
MGEQATLGRPSNGHVCLVWERVFPDGIHERVAFCRRIDEANGRRGQTRLWSVDSTDQICLSVLDSIATEEPSCRHEVRIRAGPENNCIRSGKVRPRFELQTPERTPKPAVCSLFALRSALRWGEDAPKVLPEAVLGAEELSRDLSDTSHGRAAVRNEAHRRTERNGAFERQSSHSVSK